MTAAPAWRPAQGGFESARGSCAASGRGVRLLPGGDVGTRDPRAAGGRPLPPGAVPGEPPHNGARGGAARGPAALVGGRNRDDRGGVITLER